MNASDYIPEFAEKIAGRFDNHQVFAAIRDLSLPAINLLNGCGDINTSGQARVDQLTRNLSALLQRSRCYEHHDFVGHSSSFSSFEQ